MVFYVTKNGTVIHENDVFIYKGEPYSRKELQTESDKDSITLKNWGFE